MNLVLIYETHSDEQGTYIKVVPIKAKSPEYVIDIITKARTKAIAKKSSTFKLKEKLLCDPVWCRTALWELYNCTDFEENQFEVYSIKDWFNEEGVFL